MLHIFGENEQLSGSQIYVLNVDVYLKLERRLS
jgi:hypothetical protein